MKKEYLYPNRLKEYHNFLKTNNISRFNKAISRICEYTGISTSSYYRKLDNPALYSIAEKYAIAGIYEMPVHFIFPEMEVPVTEKVKSLNPVKEVPVKNKKKEAE